MKYVTMGRSNIFASVLCVCCVSAVVEMGIAGDDIIQIEVPQQTVLQQVLVDDRTGDVYVAGRNILYHMDSTLHTNELHKTVKTGPVKDNDNCNPASSSCINASYLPNDAKVLAMDPSSGSVLFCGSRKQGLCTMYNKDLSSPQMFLDTNRINFAGGRSSVYAFFGGGQFGSDEPGPVLYVAQGYDHRPGELLPASVSARRITKTPGNAFNMSYYYSDPASHAFSAISVEPVHRASYPIDYIYGFENEGFTYFVTVQRQSVDHKQPYETTLTRVCQGDSTFRSYTVLSLNCKKRNGKITFYNIAQAAHLAPVGEDMARRYNIPPGDLGLYIVFGKSDENNNAANDSYGSGLCIYMMSEIRNQFQKTQMDCYRGTGDILLWIDARQTACKQDSSIATQITESFCGADTNVGIGSRYSMQRQTNITLDHHLVTALKVVIYEKNTIAIMGTSSGHVLKVLVNGLNSQPYADIELASRQGAVQAVQRDMEWDNTREHVYLLTGSTISKLPVHSCRVYRECSSCVMTSDPLGCGWCNDHCSREHECNKLFTAKTCPPQLYAFEPKAGPTHGGTAVTLHGRYFGNATQAQIPSQVAVSVMVALTDCTLRFRNATTMVCETGASSKYRPLDREVKVDVLDRTKTTEPFMIRGTANSGHVSFSYKEPRIKWFSPQIGPKSGGTLITVHGESLDIGCHRTVSVVGLPCYIRRHSAYEIVCTTSACKPDGNSSEPTAAITGSVNVTIDAAAISVNRSVYSYLDDPQIIGVVPLKSILSGGFPITVTGRNLHIIMFPKVEARVHGAHNGEVFSHTCRADETGLMMQCLTPDLTRAHASRDPGGPLMTSPTLPLRADVQFVMDGVTPHTFSFEYYVDPIIYSFEGNGKLRLFYQDETFLDIQGKFIDFAATEDNVKVFMDRRECNVTSLGTTVLVCKPERPLILRDPEPYRRIEVHIGARVYKVGYLQFTNRRTTELIAIAGGSILGAFCIIFTVSLFCWMKKTKRGPWRKKVPDGPNVRYVRGNIVDMSNGRDQVYRLQNENPYWSENHPQVVRHRTLLQPQPVPILDEESVSLIADQRLLIARERLLLMEIIGQGHFGCVYRGFMKMGEQKEEVEVAVKTLKSLRECTYTSFQEARKFLEEALRMQEFNHAHILRLIGIALDKDALPLVVLPFMKHGDLLSYIRNEINSPTVKDLINFGIQVADGMAYLSSLKFVHRDLAARNCMLDDYMNIKVADFGLSRDIYERDYYSSDDRKAKLPVKWMALESLEKGIYNTKTDVWSYGVVLWELMTRGVCPYPEVDNWDIIKYLKSGRRMPQPMYCPDALFSIMLQTWHMEPKLRPAFGELVHAVRSVITSMEQVHQTIGVCPTYMNVPLTQGYLYPTTSPYGPRSTLI